MPRLRRSLYGELDARTAVKYDDSGAIGRRYGGKDEIGTPWCFTSTSRPRRRHGDRARPRLAGQERVPIVESLPWLGDALVSDWKAPKGE